MYRRFLSALFCLVLMSLSFSGCAREPQWKAFSPADGSFTVSLPETPKENAITLSMHEIAQAMNVRDEPVLNGMTYALTQKERAFMVAYIDIPDTVSSKVPQDRINDLVLRGILQDSMGCNPTAQKEATLGGKKAAEFTFEGPGMLLSMAGKGIARSCYYNKRVYIALSIVPLSLFEDRKITIERFLSSFTVK